MHSTSWKFNLHIVYIFKRAWNILTEFLYSDQMISLNIFTPLLKMWGICACATRDYSLILLANILMWYQLEIYIKHTPWQMRSKVNVMNGHVTLPGNSYNICNFLVEMLTYKQTIKLSFGRNKFSRRTLQNLETKAHLWKKSRGKTD